MLNRKKERLKYILADTVAAALAWFIFYSYRKLEIEPIKFEEEVQLIYNEKFFFALFFIPIFWMNFYYLSGYYQDPYRKSRLNELWTILIHSLFGVTVLFFAFLLDDEVPHYSYYYILFFVLFALHFGFTLILRLVFATITARKVHKRIIGFNTLIVGSSEKALKLYRDLEAEKKSSGFKIIGFVHVNGGHDKQLEGHIPHLGHINNIPEIIKEHAIEEAIIAVESSEHHKIQHILNMLHGPHLFVKVIPDMYDILSGQVKMTSIFGAPLIDINREIMPAWQKSTKRILDVLISLFVLILFSWLYLLVAIIIKFSSKGPVFYSQERVGKNGKPFMIYKFRSMYVNAEQNGPQLTSEDDPRITPFGNFMRKTRLDELPQFFNVLIGDMSIVGPRPERQFFIDQIMERAPHYKHLMRVKPGITSWGQVKFGYASNVDEMIRRLEFDIIYIENMSLFVDLKILIYTVLIVLQGRGK